MCKGMLISVFITIECEGKVIILGKLGAASSVELFGRLTTISAVKCYRVVGNFIGVKKKIFLIGS